MKLLNKDLKICVVGLGYVGLPLSIAFSEKYTVLGFDINSKRIDSLKGLRDETCESNIEELQNAIEDNSLLFTDDIDDILQAEIYIVTVPTPIDEKNQPDLSPLLLSSEMIGSVLKKGDVVVYESTVFPGATEDICIPILEKKSGLKLNEGFSCGYSPERINPGDPNRGLSDIVKIVSGSNLDTANFLTLLYSSIITAGIHTAKNIKIAEAAKIIENVQRDVNIGLVNELAMLFNKLNINTSEVLEAASTKWNFLEFYPGLVGGHCIGIDPYYLTYKANSVGIDTKIITSSRHVNDNMGIYSANSFIKGYQKSEKYKEKPAILILGFAFKDNCPDHRNTRVIDIYKEINNFGYEVHLHDPHVNRQEVLQEFDVNVNQDDIKNYIKYFDAVILAVAHDEYRNLTSYIREDTFVYDIKSVLEYSDISL
jgi:UDP-N-acetyl-D-galactosamine dehydrogenase